MSPQDGQAPAELAELAGVTIERVDPEAVPRKNDRIAARVIDGRAVIVVLDQRHLHTLNEVGTRVFDLCDGRLPVHAIAAQIVQEFEVEPETALRDVQRFVRELSFAGALELPAELSAELTSNTGAR